MKQKHINGKIHEKRIYIGGGINHGKTIAYRFREILIWSGTCEKTKNKVLYELKINNLYWLIIYESHNIVQYTSTDFWI